MLKLASIVLFTIALVATNAVRKGGIDIKVEIGDGNEDIQIHEFSNYEEDHSIHNNDQIMSADSNHIDEFNSFENDDKVFSSDSSDIDDSDVGLIRAYEFGDRSRGVFYYLY